MDLISLSKDKVYFSSVGNFSMDLIEWGMYGSWELDVRADKAKTSGESTKLWESWLLSG